MDRKVVIIDTIEISLRRTSILGNWIQCLTHMLLIVKKSFFKNLIHLMIFVYFSGCCGYVYEWSKFLLGFDSCKFILVLCIRIKTPRGFSIPQQTPPFNLSVDKLNLQWNSNVLFEIEINMCLCQSKLVDNSNVIEWWEEARDTV